MLGFLDGPVSAVYHVVLTLAGVIDPALVIVVVTVVIRLSLHPLARAAARGEKARTALAPKVTELRKKYGKDPERLQRELARLQRESGTSMFAGCLPVLAQIPFFMVMYRLFSATTIGGTPNELLHRTLFGSPLGTHWLAAPGNPLFFVLFAGLAVMAWFSARLISRNTEGPVFMRAMPYGSIIGAAVIPLAAGVYLLTTTAWATAERAYLRR
jgi:YidC/Oxa1 family membrane protein insertase